MKRIFISYSSTDRDRVTGLGLLLDAMGHDVFVDHRTIKPGMRWQAKLQEGLDDADALFVFWTKRAANAQWVRKEYEYFHKQYPQRPIVPILADETALPELLKEYQHTDFVPLINTLLDTKRRMQTSGATRKEVQKAILAQLAEAGIEIDERQRKAVYRMVGTLGILGILSQPLLYAIKAFSSGIETTAALTLPQAALVAVAVVASVVVGGEVLSQMGGEPDDGGEVQSQMGGEPDDGTYLRGMGRLAVQLIDAAGEPLGGTVRIWRTENGETVGGVETMNTNASTDLMPGTYRLEIYSSGLDFYEWRDVTVSEGETIITRIDGPKIAVGEPWSGTWVTGPDGSSGVILIQDGDVVTGDYTDNRGTIEGTVEGNTLSGRFKRLGRERDGEDPNRIYSNSFKWTMNADDKSFEGTWGNGAGKWNGKKKKR